MNKKFKSNIQLEELPEKLRNLTDTHAANELHIFIQRVQKKIGNNKTLNIMVVGDGDNYPAALFAKFSILEKYNTPYVQVFTTQYALSYLTHCDHSNNDLFIPKFNLVIGIDFEGKSEEMTELAKLCKDRDFHFLLITALPECMFDGDIYFNDFKIGILSCDYTEILTDKFPHALSYTATLAPLVLFNDDTYQNYWHIYQTELKKGKEFVEKLKITNIAPQLAIRPLIHVLYERSTEPTAYDIKHKFMASGIANVILHDKGDFSNGDINMLRKHNYGIIINLIKHTANSKYNRNLDCFLNDFCSRNGHNYITIGSMHSEDSQWNINAMMMLPYLITAIGNELNIDVVNPEKQITKEETQKTFK